MAAVRHVLGAYGSIHSNVVGICGFGNNPLQIVKEIILASGGRQVVQHDLSKPNIPFSLALDSGLIKQELGWLPKISFSEGVRRTLSWYSKNLQGRDSGH